MAVRSDLSAARHGSEKAGVLTRTPRQRESGLWNFLTWSFFIAQVVAAYQLTVSSAMAAEAAQDAGQSDASVDPETIAAAIAALNGIESAIEQLTGGVAGQSTDPGGAAVDMATDAPGRAVDADVAAEVADDGGSAHRAQSSGADVSEMDSSDGQQAALIDAGDGLGSVLGPVIDVVDNVLDTVIPPVGGLVGGLVDVLDPVVDGVVEPLAGVVGELVGALEPVLDAVVAPVAGLTKTLVGSLEPVLDPLLSPVLGLTESVIELAEPLLDPILVPAVGVIEEVLQSLDPVIDPVTGLASSLTAPLGDALSPVVEAAAEVLAPVTSVVNDLTSPLEGIADTVLSPLAPVVAPLIEPLLGPVTGQLSILDGLSGDAPADSGGAQGISLSQLLDLGVGGGPIVLDAVGATAESAPGLPVVSNLDDLFSGGTYTEYNLALQSGSTTADGLGASLDESLDALVANLDAGALLSVDTSEQTTGTGGGLSSVLGGGLRFDWL
jgi:hypothetical protein